MKTMRVASMSVLVASISGCSIQPSGAGGTSSGAGADDVTVGVTMDFTCSPVRGGYFVPSVTPNPASVKVGQGIRWTLDSAPDLADAGLGTYSLTILEGTTPWTTVTLGQTSGTITFSSAGTHTYTFSSALKLAYDCQGIVQTPGSPSFTLYVTTN
jgi:hypothetical protein